MLNQLCIPLVWLQLLQYVITGVGILQALGNAVPRACTAAHTS